MEYFMWAIPGSDLGQILPHLYKEQLFTISVGYLIFVGALVFEFVAPPPSIKS